MKYFTITVLCSITGRESEYRVSFPTEEDLVKYFSAIPDKLIAVSDGWEGFLEHCWERFERRQKSKPDWQRWEGTYSDPEAYDYRKDDLL